MERLPFPQERKKHGCPSSCGSEPRRGALLAFLPAWWPQNSWPAADGHGLLQHPGLRDPSSCRGLPLPGRGVMQQGIDLTLGRQTTSLSAPHFSAQAFSLLRSCFNRFAVESLHLSREVREGMEGKHRLGGLGFLQAGREMKAFNKKEVPAALDSH